MSFRLRNGRGEIVKGTPTMRLLDAGGGLAYFVPNPEQTTHPLSTPGVWYLKDVGYESPDETYERIRVEQVEDYRVDVKVTPIGPIYEGEKGSPADTYDDYFIVEAATEQEAFRLAEAKAHEDVEHRYGEEYASDVTVTRARRGVSI